MKICVSVRSSSWGNLSLFELQYYFPENFRGNLTYYKNGVFLIAISIVFFNPKILGLFFPTKNSLA